MSFFYEENTWFVKLAHGFMSKILRNNLMDFTGRKICTVNMHIFLKNMYIYP
jgi:hypothetical protein